MLITKAGAEAEALLHDIPVEQVVRFSATSASDLQAEQFFETSLAPLGGRARELLRQAASAPLRDDWTKANDLAAHLARGEASTHSRWMSAVTPRLVLDNWPSIEAVPTALLQEEVISGERVAELCTGDNR